MFVIVNIQEMVYTESVGMSVTYLRTKLLIPCSNGSLAITIKPKAKYRFHMDTILS